MGKSPKKPKKARNDLESSSDSGTSSLEFGEPRRKSMTSSRRSLSNGTRSSGFHSQRQASEEPMDMDQCNTHFGEGPSEPQLPQDVRTRLLEKGTKDGFGRDAHVLSELAGWLTETERQKTEINLIEVALMLGGANQIFKSQLKMVKQSFEGLLGHCTAAGAEEAVTENEEHLASTITKKKKLRTKLESQDAKIPNVTVVDGGLGGTSVTDPHGDQLVSGNLEAPDVQTLIPNDTEPGPSGVFLNNNASTALEDSSTSGLHSEITLGSQEGMRLTSTADDAAAVISIADDGTGSGEFTPFGLSTPSSSIPLSQDSGFGDCTPSVNDAGRSNVPPDGLVRSLALEFDAAAQEEEQLPVKRKKQRLVMPPRDPKESVRLSSVNVGELIRAQLEIRSVRSARSSRLPILRACFDTMSICSNASSASMPCLSIQGSPGHTIEDMTLCNADNPTLIDEIPVDVATAEKQGTSSAIPSPTNEISNGAVNMPSTSAGLLTSHVVADSGAEYNTLGLLSEAKQVLFNNLSRNLPIMFAQLLFGNLALHLRKRVIHDIQLEILKMRAAADLSPIPHTNRSHQIITCNEVLRALLADAKLYVRNLSNRNGLSESRTQPFAPLARANPHTAIVHLIPNENTEDWQMSPNQRKIVKRYSPRIQLEYTFRCEALFTKTLRKLVFDANRASMIEVDINSLEQRLVEVMTRSRNAETTALKLLQLTAATDANFSARVAAGCFFAMMQLLEARTLILDEVGIDTRTIDASVQFVRLSSFWGMQTTGGAFAQRTSRM